MAFGGTAVKVCGITREEDAVMASEQGADIIGLVFSKRSIRTAERHLISRIRDHGITVAGVYTSMDEIISVNIEEDYVQMHFPHTYSDVVKVKEKTGAKVISVIDYEGTEQVKRMVREYREARSDLVMVEDRKGISGVLPSLSQMIKTYGLGVSGKISIENIRQVMEAKPNFVDLSSSLEISPGVKDQQKVSSFFTELKRYA